MLDALCEHCEFNDCAECEEYAPDEVGGDCCCGDLRSHAVACKPGCVYPEGHDGHCLDEEDVAEERLKSRDYESWANL